MISVKTLEKWSDYSEYFIAIGSLFISLPLAFIYHITLSETASDYSALFYGLMIAYPVLCVLRLVRLKFTSFNFAILTWLGCTLDIVYLTAFSYFLSVHFGTAAATFKSPAFLIYFILIGLHALRLRPAQILYMGGLTLILWMSLLSTLTTGGLNFDVSFIDNAVSEFISTKTEVIKLAGLCLFTLLAFIATLRTRNLLKATRDVQDLEKTLSQAHRSMHMKSNVLGHVSQDMRGPIGGVLNMSDALRRTNLTSQQARYVSAIEESGQAILDAVETMLNITDEADEESNSDNEASKAQSPKEFHLRPTLETIVESFGMRARAKNLELLLDDQTHRDFMVSGLPKQISKVLSNILDNAIKFTDSGSIIVTLNCDTTKGSKGIVSLSVEDTGKGIESTALEQLQERLLGKVQFSSTQGMGLVIAQMFLQSKGSELEIESTEGEGTCVSFDLELPMKAYKLSLTPIEVAHKRLSDVKLLVVDDQEQSAEILTRLLEKIDIRSSIAPDANAACVAINESYSAQQPYDLSVIDYDMSNVNGLKLVQTIRSQAELNNMKLIVTMTEDDQKIENQLMDLNVTQVLKKPIGLETLRQAIVQAVSLDASTE